VCVIIMNQEVERLTQCVLDEVKVEPTCRRLMTVPDVGPLTALAFRATIGQPGRFRKSRDLVAHLGLPPALSIRRNRREGSRQPIRP
jgi:transposase